MQIEQTANGIEYGWGLANSQGAWFVLFPDKNHTNDDIKTAKQLIRNNQDVVSMRVANDGDRYDRFRAEVFRTKKTRHLHWSQIELGIDDWKKANKEELTVEGFVNKMLPIWEKLPKQTVNSRYA